MPVTRVRETENLEAALRRFKRLCERSGVLSEAKRRQEYEKPSVRKKRKLIAARKKHLKRLAKEEALRA